MQPKVVCTECGRVVNVKQTNSKSSPVDIAKRKLDNICKEAGHTAVPLYTAGFMWD